MRLQGVYETTHSSIRAVIYPDFGCRRSGSTRPWPARGHVGIGPTMYVGICLDMYEMYVNEIMRRFLVYVERQGLELRA